MSLIGKVVGTLMQKTAKVEVSRMVLHPHVLKYLRRRKRFFAHDETEKCVVGDIVLIKSCLPISKKKHHVVQEIIESAPRYVPAQAVQEEGQQQVEEPLEDKHSRLARPNSRK